MVVKIKTKKRMQSLDFADFRDLSDLYDDYNAIEFKRKVSDDEFLDAMSEEFRRESL